MKTPLILRNITRIVQVFILSLALLAILPACQNRVKPPAHDIVEKEEAWEVRTSRNLKDNLGYALENKGVLNDSLYLEHIKLANAIYKENQHQLIWSLKGQTNRIADNLYSFITNAKLYGLFPQDYGYYQLRNMRQQMEGDTLAQKDAALWARHDLMLTNYFFSLVKDLKHGRLPKDSTTLRTDSVLTDSFFLQQLQSAIQSRQVNEVLQSLEPNHAGYDSLKAYLPLFLDSARLIQYTRLSWPYKDSIAFYKSLNQRLYEEQLLDTLTANPDTAMLAAAIRKYQQSKKMKVTGKASESLVSSLNMTDQERFKAIAINMDRYKHLPDTMPLTYIWVNLPSFMLTVWDSGYVEMESRVIVGTPKTSTPLLKSDITNFITYPQWTVPYSIIFKEMLPQIKKNIGYLAKENLMVVDKNDSVLDPAQIDWKKLSKTNFPYLLKQREGDNNSLGVIKFNFRNKYSVYLHDTNARWLFSKSQRALSHGCVRVKEWDQLARFLVRNVQDKYPVDSLQTWIKRQEKHVVSGFQKVPVYIRYFTCEGKGGKLNFFEDIYKQDRVLADKYFAGKTLD
ncbi:MAG TPA: L,D-transpeptidase family protein [Chitinophagaceae bacterium]|nr:L,D-transpeptidase family protein [Chitinophagaceae bacterium]